MTSEAVAHLLALLRLRGGPSATDARAMWQALSACSGYDTVLQREGATLWLYRRLHACGVALDSAAGVTLRESAHQQLMLGLRVDGEMLAVATILRDAAIPFVPIKGPARRIAAGLYPYADARATSDVDLLVPEARAREAYDTLAMHGYRPAIEPEHQRAEHFHLPPLMAERGVAVELHTSTAPWLSPAEAWRRQSHGSEMIRWEGLDFHIAGATELLWHAMAHAFIDGADGFRVRTFLDGAVVIASGRSIDWACITQRIAAGEIREAESGVAVTGRQLRRWLATAGMLAGVALPAEFAGDGLYPVARVLNWKLLVARAGVGRAVRERLVEEAVRSETGMALTPAPRGVPTWVRARRRVATAAARAGYASWRATLGSTRGAP